MKIDLRRLTLAAMMLSTSATYVAVASAQTFVGDAEYYGAQGGFVSDASNNETPLDEAFAEDQTPSGPAVQQVSASMYIGDEVAPATNVSPARRATTTTPYRAAAHQSMPYASQPAYSSVPCDSGCDAAAARSRIGSAVYANDTNVWMKAELLLWFPQSRNTPPLGVRSEAGSVPALNQTVSPTATPFGDNFGGDLTPGFRGDIGRYFGDGTFGIGGRVWILADDEEELAYGGNGLGESLGIPFFNTNPLLVGEDAIFIGFNDGIPRAQGDVAIRSALSIVAAEIYGRALMGESKNHRFELLGGYSHFNLQDELDIRVNAIELPAGVQTVFNDSFRTRNEFHGGQIGGEISLQRGRWTASSLTKVHLGNMSQQVKATGTTARAVLPAVPAVVAANDGLFARGDARRLGKQDVFAFAPEMNLKLGYQFREHVNFHVGYSFIYWNNVALAGDQLDRNLFVDTANYNLTGDAGVPKINSGGFFVQGIDLGATIEF